MKVADLIAELAKMPQDADTLYLYDGDITPEITTVWFSRSGTVLVSDGQAVYHPEDWPIGVVPDKRYNHWTPPTIEVPSHDGDGWRKE